MQKVVWFFLGAITLAVLVAAGGLIFLRVGANGYSTRSRPSAMERLVARQSREMAMPIGARERRNPVAESPEVLAEGRAHWADHCATCHANNGSGDAEIGKHMYPPAPDMRQAETQNLTDGELYYIIQNGIRLTGMPSWGSGTSKDEEDSWKLVRFIRHLPKLTPAEENEMEELNPRSRQELKEEQEERDFLNGGHVHEHTDHKHQ
jgi:mono/diheme cytochrome c family protein